MDCMPLIGEVYSLKRPPNSDPLLALVKMMSSSPGRLAHRIAGAFCLLLVSWVIAPSTAQGSCGHNVTSIWSRSAQASHDRLVPIGSGKQSGDTSPVDSRRSPTCTGRFCSSEGRGPHRLPAFKYSPTTGASCCGLLVQRWTEQHAVYRVSDLVVAHPRHGIFPIDRPPRSTFRRPNLGTTH
jgi:hypothetical protein